MAIRDLFSRKQVCHFLVTDEGEIAKKYNHFMEFLTSNRAALGIISELEQLYYGSGPFTMAGVESHYGKLAAATGNLVEALNGLAPGKYEELSRVSDRIAQEIAPIFASVPPPPVGELVLPLEALSPDMVKVAGSIDQAGGLAFGIRNINNYFVLRINALEDNVILFEYVNNRRLTRAAVHKEIKKDEWYLIAVEITGNTLKGYLDDEQVMEYTAERPLAGYVGLWTKADSVTYFDELTIEEGGKKRVIDF